MTLAVPGASIMTLTWLTEMPNDGVAVTVNGVVVAADLPVLPVARTK
jgi:hypothetical protein